MDKVNESNQSENPKPELPLKPDSDEIGAIGISLGLTALAGTIVFAEKISIFTQIVCLIIYILGGLATSFLYFTFLINKIPETMKKWHLRGGLNKVRGIFWIYKYYMVIFFRQMFHPKGNNLTVIRELGYLTILAMLNILWITFGLALFQIILKKP
jgi:hypothetical protein